MRRLCITSILAVTLSAAGPAFAEVDSGSANGGGKANCSAGFFECFSRSLDQVGRKVGLVESSPQAQPVKTPQVPKKATTRPVAITPGRTTAL
ncbi:hypothetical protein ACFSM5_06280 [Lacibacterium aquatile]|uniref:Uncharacterized protein n=1 Tax=Lacibacterium aquatile TaxID=1168082 RepID=A0ABW5DNJ0_9PROT